MEREEGRSRNSILGCLQSRVLHSSALLYKVQSYLDQDSAWMYENKMEWGRETRAYT
jgi:hypothetical protein